MSIKGHILIIIIIINALIKVTLSQGLQLLQGFPRSKQPQIGSSFRFKNISGSICCCRTTDMEQSAGRSAPS